MFALYVLSLLAAITASLIAYRAARWLAVPPVLAVCVCAGTLFYVSSLIPGALTVLSAPAVTITMVATSAAVVLLLGRLTSPARVGVAPRPSDIAIAARYDGLLVLPALLYYARAYRPWTHLQQALSWDAVSYHLPGFVEFYQHHSLYSLLGPYQTYSFGFELIANFPFYFFQQNWGVFAAHVYSVLFVFAALHVVMLQVAPLAGLRSALHVRVAYFVGASAFVWMFHPSIFRLVGNNDLFQGAATLASAGLLLELLWSAGDDDRPRAVLLISLSSVAMALAVATKPTGLAYVPLVPIACGLLYYADAPRHEIWRWQRCVAYACGSLAAIAVLGGFFLERNLLTIGGVVSQDAAQWKLSVVANLANPALYRPQREALLALLSVITPIGFLVIGAGADRRSLAVRAVTVLLCCAALAAFVLAPWVILPDTTSNVRWELRLAIPLFAMLCALGGVIVSRLVPVPAPLFPRGVSSWPALPVAPVVASATIAGALLVPLSATPVRGLPGFEQVNGLPRTSVYEWVQTFDRPTRIYAAGLRPYGLYGRTWQNDLFYDLHSSVLRPADAGRARVAAIIVQFHPDLLLISVDPHDSTPADKPLAAWLRAQRACFEDIFEDAVVSGFRVKEGCDLRLKADSGVSRKVRMTG